MRSARLPWTLAAATVVLFIVGNVGMSWAAGSALEGYARYGLRLREG
jgi:hypothetical protein